MGVSKVVFNQKTLVDLTSDTVTPETLLEGITAHNASGELITGILAGGNDYEITEGTVTYASRVGDAYQKFVEICDIGMDTMPDVFILYPTNQSAAAITTSWDICNIIKVGSYASYDKRMNTSVTRTFELDLNFLTLSGSTLSIKTVIGTAYLSATTYTWMAIRKKG